MMTTTGNDQQAQALYLLGVAREGKPHIRYAVSRQFNAIGAWNAELGRFQMVASYGIDGNWYHVPHEILVNGEPPFKPTDWNE